MEVVLLIDYTYLGVLILGIAGVCSAIFYYYKSMALAWEEYVKCN